ncbi:Glycerophosphoryl diester phosphodiesterase family protein [compost metagenome]
MNQASQARNLLVHVYTLDEPVDFDKAMKAGVDGIFTNRTGALLRFYQRSAEPETVALERLGY